MALVNVAQDTRDKSVTNIVPVVCGVCPVLRGVYVVPMVTVTRRQVCVTVIRDTTEHTAIRCVMLDPGGSIVAMSVTVEGPTVTPSLEGAYVPRGK